MKILMVLTSHDRLGSSGKKTGFWLEEFAAPYYAFIDANADVTLASPKGGQPPMDPQSDTAEGQTESMKRFKSDPVAQFALSTTVKLSTIDGADHDAVFFPGGHGPLWDLAEDAYSIALIEAMFNAGKPVASVCHAPAVLRHVRINGASIVAHKRVTGFSNDEEDAVHLTKVVPFLLEDELRRLGGQYVKGPNWSSFAVSDGQLITGQNPNSSAKVAELLLQQLSES